MKVIRVLPKPGRLPVEPVAALDRGSEFERGSLLRSRFDGPFGRPAVALVISFCGSETAQHVAPEIALLCGGRSGKRCWVEGFAAGKLRAIEHKRHSGHHVRVRIERNAGRKHLTANHVYAGTVLAKMKLSADQPPNAPWAIL
jgi:hypothetical protein